MGVLATATVTLSSSLKQGSVLFVTYDESSLKSQSKLFNLGWNRSLEEHASVRFWLKTTLLEKDGIPQTCHIVNIHLNLLFLKKTTVEKTMW